MAVVDGWLTEALRAPCANWDARPAGEVPSLLVIHNISLPPGRYGGGHIQDFFANRLRIEVDPYFATIAHLRVSAHLLIDRQGIATQFVSCNDRAWHAGASCFAHRERCNDFAIGIELEGTDIAPYTDHQYTTLLRVTRTLMAAYPQITPQRIVGHSDIAPARKSDPGIAFDWFYYLSALRNPHP